MTIIHLCIGYPVYVDGGYQDNLITREHVRQGHEVYLLASTIKRFDDTLIQEDFVTGDGVHYIYTPYKNIIYFKKFGIIKDLYKKIAELSPDIIFVHSGYFVSMRQIIRYCRKHSNVKLYIDCHSDYYNTPIKTLKDVILYRVILAFWLRKAYRYVVKYWGVTPWRCQFLHEVFGIPKDKIDLLVMGGDDDKIHFEKRKEIRGEIREKLNISTEDFVVISGGKIDREKNIHLLMEAVAGIKEQALKLIVFGKATGDMRTLLEVYEKNDNIRYIGWIDANEVYDYFLASDLAFFPGTHSVLWEQACACGLPIVVKRWPQMEHIDVGGNCIFLDEVTVEKIQSIISLFQSEDEKGKELFASMKKVAVEKGMLIFSYRRIAAKAIGMYEE